MIDAVGAGKGLNVSPSIPKNRESLYKALWHICLFGIVAYLGLWLWQNGPELSLVAWLLYSAGVAATLYRPRYGIYTILFWGLVGDQSLMYWYPFEKNFSSAESLLYLDDSLIISPLESFIVITILSWIGRLALTRDIELYAGELLIPGVLFGGSLVVGLLYGLGTGGSAVIALWESRPIFYLPVMLVLTSNLITERSHIKSVMWVIISAIFIESLIACYIFIVEMGGSISGIDRLADHAASIHINSLFVFAAATWLYRVAYAKRFVLFLMLPPIALAYLASQRRAAFVTLAVAIALFMFLLFVEKRRVFWVVAPIIGFVGLMYMGVFWNSTSSIALPAQAIKSIVAPDPNSVDSTSNIYRVLENVNVNYTIHESPLFGVGFGNKFYLVVSMADISFFDWWEYIVHNSIFWFWMKTGVFGFISMLLLISSSILVGVRVIWRLPGEELNAIALTCTLYVIMHFLYAYVDMSWDNQSMLYVGTSLGLLNCFEHVVAKPLPIVPKKWNWQSDPQEEVALVPLQYES